MNTYRVFVPGVGNIYIQALSPDMALEGARRYLRDNEITVEQGSEGQQTVTPFNEGQVPADGLRVNMAGKVVSGELQPVPPAGGTGGSSTPGENPQAPGATPPAATQPGAGQQTGTAQQELPVNTDVESEFISPSAGFRAFAQSQGLPTSGVMGSFLNNQITDPFLLQLESLRGGAQSSTTGLEDFSLSDYLGQNIGQQGVLRGLGNAALGDLRTIAGAAGHNAADPFTNVTDFGSDGAQTVLRGAQAGLMGRNPAFASMFGDELRQGLRRRFDDSAYRGEQPQNFINYALSNFGLG